MKQLQPLLLTVLALLGANLHLVGYFTEIELVWKVAFFITATIVTAGSFFVLGLNASELNRYSSRPRPAAVKTFLGHSSTSSNGGQSIDVHARATTPMLPTSDPGGPVTEAYKLERQPRPFPAFRPIKLPRLHARGAISRHWRGEYRLLTSFWLIGFVFPILYSLFIRAVLESRFSLLANFPVVGALTIITVLLSGVILFVWVMVGVWRSAANQRRSGKGKKRALAAMSYVALNTIFGLLYAGLQTGPSIYELARYALDGPMKYTVKVVDDDVVVSGYLDYGAADDVEHALRVSGSKFLILRDIGGGRVDAAVELVERLHRDKIWTLHEGQCHSSCILLLAGMGQSAFVWSDLDVVAHKGTLGWRNSSGDLNGQVSALIAYGAPSEFISQILRLDVGEEISLGHNDLSKLFDVQVINPDGMLKKPASGEKDSSGIDFTGVDLSEIDLGPF